MTYVLAIDGGSQSTKVSVVDARGTVVATAQVPLRPYTFAPGGAAVHPGDDLWDTLVEAVVAVLAQFDGDPADVVGVGLCGIRSCRALVGADGRLTEPVQSWMDERVSRPLEDPGTATLVTSAGGYLAVRLTGQRRDSAAAYAGCWPIEERTGRWSDDPDVLRSTGLRRDLLPELVEPGEPLGTVSSEAARATGLRAGCPVVATANDKAVEALGAGVVSPGTTLLSLGTYVAAMTVSSDVPDDSRLWRNRACVPGRQLAESGGVRWGMSTVAWLRGLLGAGSPSDDDALEAVARALPPGSEGVLTVPDWLAPVDATFRRGSITGLRAGHGAEHLYRSVLEGLVLTMRGAVDDMDDALGGGARQLLVSGGGSRSDLMMQVVADVMDRPARRAGHADAAGLGAAICAAVGTGLHETFDDAVAAMVDVGPTWLPDPAASAVYDRLRIVHAAVRDALDPVYRDLADALTPTDR